MLDISVIIPTRNRAATLLKCLGAIKNQDFAPSRFEIIVIDDASKDDTAAVVKSIERLQIKYYKLPENKGPAAARNYGISNTSAEILAFIDDDCFAQANWLSEIFRLHKEYPNAQVIQGEVELVRQKSIANLAQRYIYEFSNKLRKANNLLVKGELPEAYFIGTGNLSVKRSCFDSMGLFDESLLVLEDRDFYYRLLARGIKIYYSPTVRVQHQNRKTLYGFLRQYYYYGQGNAVFERKWREERRKTENCSVYDWDTYREYLKTKGIGIYLWDEKLNVFGKNFGGKEILVFLILCLKDLCFRLGKKFKNLELNIKHGYR